ncbi:conjugal transfer protein [Xanthomonas oryzae pv. oryzicola]|uniref:TrbC/VirB2 family protein n=1 Tax=Xanthomonas oryzae TaxID=347 RepID=UPI0006439459|nr:TrbC/VirB2 family protein [Xanthomonas oryzae]AKK65873.1 conjugal transfer protein [Xanthomonas oryzae pv. oryzicola]AZK89868.1 conjugal transfer protein [Xanthomonas oryzae pv. oryzae]PNR84143.1 conjugal transfer protein [Xanthomonas oryzae pv. oryzae]
MQFTLPRFSVSNRALLILGVALLLLIVAHPAFASNTSGGGLPFDDWFTKIRQSVTGPFAFTASIVGLVGAGVTLLFGGDMNGFLRTLMFIALVLCFVVTAQNTIAAITGQGAEITALSNALADRLQARLA